MDARWYSSDLARFTSPDYYNLQQLALPAGARHQLLPYLGKNYQDLLRDPAQQMRYGYVTGNQLGKLDWSGLEEYYLIDEVCYVCTSGSGSYINIPVQKYDPMSLSSKATLAESIQEGIRMVNESTTNDALAKLGSLPVSSPGTEFVNQKSLERRFQTASTEAGIEQSHEFLETLGSTAYTVGEAYVLGSYNAAVNGTSKAKEIAKEFLPSWDDALSIDTDTIDPSKRRRMETVHGDVDRNAYPSTNRCVLNITIDLR